MIYIRYIRDTKSFRSKAFCMAALSEKRRGRARPPLEKFILKILLINGGTEKFPV